MFMNQYLVTEGDPFCCLLITFLLYHQRLDVYVIDLLYVVYALVVISLIVLINTLG